MFGIGNKKDALRRTITRWGSALGDKDHARAWQAVDAAILALDNAAYDRVYKQRTNDAGYRAERDAACAELATARIRGAESVKLLAALGRIEVLTRRGMNDTDLLPVVKQAQSEAWRAYRGANAAVLPIGEPIDISTPEPSEIERLQVELADAQSDLGIVNREKDDKQDVVIRLREELTRERRAVEWALKKRDDVRHTLDELRALVQSQKRQGAREYSQVSREAEQAEKERDRLRVALETLADRYHRDLCKSCSGEKSRQECGSRAPALRDAEKALAGESEKPHQCCVRCKCGRTLKPQCNSFPPHRIYWLHECRECREYTTEEQAARELAKPKMRFDDRKPQEDPDIEAVLIGSRELACAGGCGRVVKQGGTMYRHAKHVLAVPPLYATKECARRGPSAPAPPKEPKPDITKIDVLRACRLSRLPAISRRGSSWLRCKRWRMPGCSCIPTCLAPPGRRRWASACCGWRMRRRGASAEHEAVRSSGS